MIYYFQGEHMLVLPLIVMGVLLILGGFASLCLPETKGRNLPQTLDEGEHVPLTGFLCCCQERPLSQPKRTVKPQPNKEMECRKIVCSICKDEIRNIHL